LRRILDAYFGLEPSVGHQQYRLHPVRNPNLTDHNSQIVAPLSNGVALSMKEAKDVMDVNFEAQEISTKKISRTTISKNT